MFVVICYIKPGDFPGSRQCRANFPLAREKKETGPTKSQRDKDTAHSHPPKTLNYKG